MSRFSEYLRQFLAQSSTVSTQSIFKGLTTIIIVRSIVESLLEESHTVAIGDDFYAAVLGGAHVYISWLCLFVCIGIIVSIYVSLTLKHSLLLVLYCSPVIMIVPLLDYFTNGGASIRYGATYSDLLYNYTHLFSPFAHIHMVSTGVRVEVFLVTTAAFLVTLSLGKSLIRAIAFALTIYSTIFVFGYLPALHLELPGLGPSESCISMYLPVVCILLSAVAICLGREHSAWHGLALYLLYPSRLMFYLFIMIFGMIFALERAGTIKVALDNGTISRLVLAIASITLLFIYSKLTNDAQDRDIDLVSNPRRLVATGAILPAEASRVGTLFVLPSCVFGLAADQFFVFLWLTILASCVIYSQPPFRMRRFYPFGHLLLSFIGTSVFVAGATLVASKDVFHVADLPRLAAYIFLCFFFLSPIKDLKDIDGDPEGGVMNIYNTIQFPKTISLLAIMGFLIMLILALRLIGAFSFVVYTMIGVYAAVALWAIIRSPDVRRLDWILQLSWLLICGVGVSWLLGLVQRASHS